MTQIAINSVNNKNLFSNYYLDNLIENIPEWKKDDHKDAFQRIKKIWTAESAFLETLNEKQLEQRFFGPIFNFLNHTVEVNESTKFQEFPDYALFPSRESLDDAHRNKDSSSFYNNAYAIGEVKRWGIELDRFGKDKNDRKRNPSLQIWIYLHDNNPKWGILSNGAKWRLYNKDERRDEYFEIDLPTLLATDDVDNFRYFYYFFRMEAFLPSQEGEPFLERVLHESVEYANGIGDDLKENVYRAMKKIGEGFFNWKQNKLDIQNEATREIVQKNTMLLLYRFLFLLYAEGKGLLDLGNPFYRDSYSFQRLKHEVKEKHDGPQQNRYQPLSTTLWSRLEDLFRLIDQGSEALGAPKSEFSVPAYNGGLFDPEKHSELEIWKIGDSYLAEAIDLLSRSNVNEKLDFVDYSTLEIRHLGSIYEGLLEYKLKVSEEDMVVKGGEWCTLEIYNEKRKQPKELSDFDEYNKVTKDQLYLATDKGDRKSTGSYYTPDYIVNYIVKNTIGPVVEEKWNEAKAKGQSHVDATLSVKVLDPAMGSGHFLVGAIDFLAEKLLRAAQIDIENGIISDDSHFTEDWARREVVSHCIYGVDLNYMAVELAKVGLWLTTISKDKPLSFLDHRLKQGNSLIGAKLTDLPWYPDLKDKTKKKENTTLQKFEEEVHRPFVDRIVQQLNTISEIDDDTIEHINQKKALFEKLKENKQYLQIKSIADVYTAVYFGNETTEVNKNPKFAYNDLFWALKGDDREWSRKTYKPWFKNAMRIASDKSFFHWELEFPEVFFEGGAPKDNPGWDAVVGNPPWGAFFEEMDKEYNRIEFSEIIVRMVDSFMFFLYKGFTLLRNDGLISEIVPNPFFIQGDMKLLRKYFIENSSMINLLNLGDGIFGTNVTAPSCVFVLSKNISKKDSVRVTDLTQFDIDGKIHAISKNDVEKIVPQSFYQEAQNHSFITKGFKHFDIIKKLIDDNPTLREFLKGKIERGISADLNEAYIVSKSDFENNRLENVKCRPVIDGRSITRYNLSYNDKYIIYTNRDDDIDKYPSIKDHLLKFKDKIKCKEVLSGRHPWFALHRPRNENIFGSPKLIGLTTTDRIIVSTDLIGYYSMDSLYNINLNLEKYKIFYFASLLNSHLITFIYRYFAQEENRILPQVKAQNLYSIPIRHISFNTPSDRCVALVADAKALYSEFVGLSDSLKILEFVDARLSAAPEESDVVHDLLAYLAERMIGMNKEKNIEVNGFLDWLEGEIGASVDDFSNKTSIKNYYIHDFETIAKILAKNKKKLKEGYDPTRRGPKEKIQAEYDTSISKLAPLLENIKATDGLIDAIVYKLYGLTEDEIKIVEGIINGK